MDDLLVFEYLSPFYFWLLEFHCTFSMSYKILTNYVYYYCTELLLLLLTLFVPTLLLSILASLFLPSSSVTLSYLILVVPMRECLGKHSCMISSFPIAILNGTYLFPTVQLQEHTVYSEQKTRNR